MTDHDTEDAPEAEELPVDTTGSPERSRRLDLRRLGESALDTVIEHVGRGVGRIQERRPLEYDLLEGDDAYLVVFDAPGADRDDVQVRLVDRRIEVRIDRFREFHEGFEMRFPGRGLSLEGRAHLPSDADTETDEASATLTDDGTLRVRVPRAEDARTVPVTDENQDAA